MDIPPSALKDDELLAVVLESGGRGKHSLELAREILGRLSQDEFSRSAAAELGRRWSSPETLSPSLEDPAQVWDALFEVRGRKQEHFVAFYLNARNRLVHRETVSIGTLTASLVHPREVFAPAIERRAAAMIIAHNHPSGELRPSPEDREATRRIAQAGRILGIGLLDHVVVAENGYYSFKQEGLL